MTEAIVLEHKHPISESIPLFPGVPPVGQAVEEMLRVDLAGEEGAKRIYEGQLWVLKTLRSHPVAELIEHMYDQEVEHAKQFQTWVGRHHARPTLLAGLWHVAGFALGAGSALLGVKAAMACTVGVEEVIDAHYQDQIKALPEAQAPLKQFLEACRQDELEHRDHGYAQGAESMPGFKAFAFAVRGATRLAIALSKRI